MSPLSKILFLISGLLNFSGCYLWHVSQGQLDLESKVIPLEEALAKPDLTEKERKLLNLVSEVKEYTKNTISNREIDEDIYSGYVDIERDYVTYIVRVAYAYELKAYLWWFPFVGYVPYKGFFEKEKALDVARSFSEDKYDTLVRGASAYSTLGWREDPITSAMLNYSEGNFVTTLFHELTHTILFFKDHVDFNERFAEFVGRKMALSFFRDRDGPNSPVVKELQAQWQDQTLFSSFISKEYKALKRWYIDNKGPVNREKKKERLKEIQNRFINEVSPQLQTNQHDYFAEIELNNAIMLSFRSYYYNMDEFEKVFISMEQNIEEFINYCFLFKNAKDPEKAFRESLSEIPDLSRL